MSVIWIQIETITRNDTLPCTNSSNGWLTVDWLALNVFSVRKVHGERVILAASFFSSIFSVIHPWRMSFEELIKLSNWHFDWANELKTQNSFKSSASLGLTFHMNIHAFNLLLLRLLSSGFWITEEIYFTANIFWFTARGWSVVGVKRMNLYYFYRHVTIAPNLRSGKNRISPPSRWEFAIYISGPIVL